MGQPSATPVPAYPTAKSESPVRIFRAGDYTRTPAEDDNWTTDKLQRVVDNYHRFQAKNDPRFHEPTSVYLGGDFLQRAIQHPEIGQGHEPGQDFLRAILKRTDLPAAGWPKNLRLDESGDLWADFEGMPAEVASLINGGLLPYTSCEFKRDVKDADGNSYGPMLRRVSLLGAELPRVPGLGRTPPMVYAEPLPGAGPAAMPQFSCFSETDPDSAFAPEVPTVDRAALLNQLAAMGVDVSQITDAVPDAVLQSIVTACGKSAAPPAQPAAPAASAPVTTYADKDDVKLFAEACKPEAKPEERAAAVSAFSERIALRAAAAAVAPLQGQVATLTAQNAGLQRQVHAVANGVRNSTAAAERSEVAAFCDRMVVEFRLEPRELDAKTAPGGRSIVDALLELDNGEQVSTFGDRKLTRRQAEMERIAARPPLRNGGPGAMRDPITDGANDPAKVPESRVKELMEKTTHGRAVIRAKAAR